MSEHRIRLRGGWEARALDAMPWAANRLTLPIRWDLDRPRRLRLARRFQRPPLEGPSHRGSRRAGQPDLRLLLEHVPGLIALELNGESPVCVSPEQTRYEVPLGRLPQRSQLVLEVETPRRDDRAGGEAPEWGSIALVIRSAGP
jgi:hypothetical protein